MEADIDNETSIMTLKEAKEIVNNKLTTFKIKNKQFFFTKI